MDGLIELVVELGASAFEAVAGVFSENGDKVVEATGNILSGLGDVGSSGSDNNEQENK